MHPRVVDRSTIQAFAEELVRRFSPEKIVLFGSYARGQATALSDVDLLVITNHVKPRNIDKAIEILDDLDPRFSIDLLVRRPEDIRHRIELGDFFMREILLEGQTLYEANHERVA